MKIKGTDNQEIVIGGAKEMSFSVDDSNPIIFDILRNKMYSNKIGAICREVSSNSRDANREAGLADQPIEIEFTSTNSIFNIGDTCIIFRDFGLGINPDRMENVFVKYASSTKRSSNAQTGGFGLGAKTPFAYTDSFIVKTVCNVNGDKWEYIYNAIIDRSGKGKMILLDEKLTDSPTGTEIIVPINSTEDRNKFEHECYRATMFWEKVNYLGFSSHKPELDVVYETDLFKIIKPVEIFDTYNEHYIGLIDGIPYPVYPSKCKGGLGDRFQILFDVEVERVTINANRESIQTDKETTDYLDEKVEWVEEFLKEEFDNYCVNHDNYIHALKKYTVLRHRRDWKTDYSNLEEIILDCKDGYSDRVLNKYEFDLTYNGEKVSSRLGLKYHYINKVTNTELDMDDEGKILACKFDYKKLDSLTGSLVDKPLYYFDGKKHSAPKNLKILEDEGAGCFILIKAGKDVTEEQIKEDLDTLKKFDIAYKNYNDVDATKKKLNYKREKTPDIQVIARDGRDYRQSLYLNFNENDKKLTNYGDEFSPKTTAIYPIWSLKDSSMYDRSIEDEQFRVLKAFNKVERVLIVNERTYNKHLKPNGFKTVGEFFKKLKKDDLIAFREFKQVNELFDKSIPKFILDHFVEILPKSTQNLLEIREKVLIFVQKKKINLNVNDIRWDRLGIEGSKFNYQGYKKKFFSTMSNHYPMILPYLESQSLYSRRGWGDINSDYGRSELKTQRAKNVISKYINCIK